MDNPKCSIVICSLNRQESLNRCLKSIERGEFKDYEIVLCEEEGKLVELKDKGWRKAGGEYIIWVDDDIEVQGNWLNNIITIFETREDVVGITGPTYVSSEYLKNRDVFRGGYVGWLYNKLFLDGKKLYPGYISRAGASSHGANYPTEISLKSHFVDFLEPSQFAIRRDVMEVVNGFDLGFGGIGEWCDVDLCYRIRKYGKLLYHPQVKVYHYPVKDNVANKRLETTSRYRNYCRWANRYIRRTFKHRLYRLFLKAYFFQKSRCGVYGANSLENDQGNKKPEGFY